jgi:predicted acetyltransferase
MQRHLDDARERRFPVSGLWASEATIYGRFGYGLAAYCDVYDIANAHTLRIADREFDTLEWLDEARARDVLPAIYARATAERPGALRRNEVWWRERRFLENGWARAGASKRRHVAVRRGNELVGYVAFRQNGKFTDGVPTGHLSIIELVGIDARAEASLWKFALSVDLFPNVTYWNAPADDPLPWLVDDFRRVKRRRGDNLWLRIDDVPATLERRWYGCDGVLRIGAGDTTYELAVESGRGRCTQTTRAPDLSCDMPTLATLYLGCARATELVRSERVRGDRAALSLADQLFATQLAPWCPEVF